MAEIIAPTEASSAVPTVPAGNLCLYPDATSLGWKTKTPAGNIAPVYGQGPNPWFDVTAFGAKGDGTTDDTTALQAAITAACVGVNGRSGGKVYFPSGVYKTTAPLTLTAASNNVAFVGADRGSSVINPQFATGDVLQLLSGGAFFTILDIGIIATSVTRTANALINTNGANDVIITNVQLTGGFVGIAVQGASIKVHITNTEVNSTVGTTGVGILVNNGSAGDTYIGPGIVMSNGTAPLAGIQILATGHCSINQANITKAINGLLINPAAGQVVNYLFCTHSLFDSCAGNGININATSSTSTIESLTFVNSWSSGTTSGGGAGIITQGTAGGIIDGVTFESCRILNNQTHGVQHGFGNNVTFMGCVIAGNSQASSGANDGVNVAAGLNKFYLIGNTVGTSGTSQSAIQRWGVNVLAGASNNYVIAHNNLLGQVVSTTGGAVFDGGAPVGLVQKSVVDNLGSLMDSGISSTTAASAAINTTETVVAGGLNSGAVIPANSPKVGTVFRAILFGACTATVANAQTWTIRCGTAGTTADAAIATVAVTSAASGAGVVFKAEIVFVVTAIGATGAIAGNLTLYNTGITGAATNNVTSVALTPTSTLNTQVTNYLTISFKTAATTTTDTFTAPCLIEVVRP